MSVFLMSDHNSGTDSPKVKMQGKLFQRCAHLFFLQCTVSLRPERTGFNMYAEYTQLQLIVLAL